MPEISESLTTRPASAVDRAEAAAAIVLAFAVLLVPLLFSTNTPYALDIKRPISGTCALLAGLALLARWAAGGRIPDAIQGVVRVAGLFVAALAVSLAFAPYTQAGLRGTWLLDSHVIIFVAAAVVFRRRLWAEAFMIVLLVTASIVALCGCLQAAGIDIGLVPLSWSKGDRAIELGHGERILSTIGLETALGGYMAACAILALGAMLHFKDPLGRGALGAGACLMIACMLFSGTRMACFAFTAGLAVGVAMLLRTGNRGLHRRFGGPVVLAVVLISTIGISALFLPVIGKRIRRITSDVSTHTTIWKSAWAMFDSRPLVGVGPGAFAIHFPEFRPADYARHGVTSIALRAHNEYLEILAEAGMLGAMSFLLLIGLVVAGSVRRLGPPSEKNRILLNAAFAAAATMLVHACASVDTRYPTCQLMLWVLMGLAVARWKDASDDDEPVERPVAPAWRAAVVLAGIGAAVAIWATQVYGPHRARVYLNEAENHQHSGRLAESVLAASRALEFDPVSVPSYYVLANSLFYAGEYEAALAAFDKLQDHSPGYAHSHVRMGVLNALLGRMEAARRELRLARRYGVAGGALARADELSDDELRKHALDFRRRHRPRSPHLPGRRLSEPACGSRDTSPPAR